MGTVQKIPEDPHSYVDELSPGTTLLQGQYTIQRFLNSGGFGITYLATNSLDREVVIKECFPSAFCHRSRSIVQVRSRAHTAELKSIVDLFVQEARSLSRLDHPNIVGVHQVFEDNETAYMVLDFVEGRDLLDVLEDPDHGLTAEQIKGILRDVLGAVAFIHEQDILHRDISPDNILLDEDMRPVLIDFGAAREEATKKSRVLSALRVVKDGYSPQEFYVQGSIQSPSSDLYALGATFYHLIMGETPPNSQARLAAIATGEADLYEPLVDRVKGFDRRFLSAIDKSLGILPKDRMQSAQEWLDIMDGTRNKSRVVTQQLPKSSAAAATLAAERKSSRLVPLLGSVAVVALVAVGALVATGAVQLPLQEPAARTAPAAPTPVEKVSADPAPAAVPMPAKSEIQTAALAPTIARKPDIAAPVPSSEAKPAAEVAPAPVVEPLKDAAPVVSFTAAAYLSAPVPGAAADIALASQPIKPVVMPVPANPVDTVAFEAPEIAPDVLATPVPMPPAEIADVITAWSVELPFEGRRDTTTIGEVDMIAPAWALRGVELVGVNGQDIAAMSDVNDIITKTQTPNDAGLQPVVFTIRPSGDAEPVSQPWQLAVVQTTDMANGLQFKTRHNGAEWVTKVSAVGAAQTDLKVGDVVVGYVPTSETLDQRTSISTIISRELQAGTEQFSFAVARDGSIWVASLVYADPSSVPTQ